MLFANDTLQIRNLRYRTTTTAAAVAAAKKKRAELTHSESDDVENEGN